jgi:hypothetical protein
VLPPTALPEGLTFAPTPKESLFAFAPLECRFEIFLSILRFSLEPLRRGLTTPGLCSSRRLFFVGACLSALTLAQSGFTAQWCGYGL